MARAFRIGIDLGGTKIEAAAVDPDGSIRARRRIVTPAGDYRGTIAAIAGLSSLSLLYEEVPRRWERHIFSDKVATRLLPPRHGDASGVRGAAWLWPPERPEQSG